MKLALGGFFAMMAVAALLLWHYTGSFWASIGADGFAISAIALLGSILVEYEGKKRQ